METLQDYLVHMSEHGSSVTLNWGEDDNLWECSWITAGERFTAFHPNPWESARRAVDLVQRAAKERAAGRAP